MYRKKIEPRKNWQKIVESQGFLFHTPEQTYWNESVCYEFSMDEVNKIEKVTNDLHEMCIHVAEKIIQNGDYSRLCISPMQADLINSSWENDHRSIYGRIDLCATINGEYKMLEYNADTPTSLYESAIIQWHWLKDQFPKNDQFNSIHDRLIQRWPQVVKNNIPTYFTSLRGHVEDLTVTEYLRDTAQQANCWNEQIYIEDIGFDQLNDQFVDLQNNKITQCFKLYPWEWLMKDDFGSKIKKDFQFIEPAWKQILSSKAILALLWDQFPNHPNLLPAFFEAPAQGKFIKKPFYSREGQNISIIENQKVLVHTYGNVESENYIYQAYQELPNFDGHYLLIGSWIIGEEAAGIGLREDTHVITQNLSQFIPHYIKL